MEAEISFGERLRSLREAKGIGLRRFAEKIGMSATYLSKIERGAFLPPSEEKVRAIARALGQNEDEFLALAGRIPADLPRIIQKQPVEMATFLRTAEGLSREQMKKLINKAAKMKRIADVERDEADD